MFLTEQIIRRHQCAADRRWRCPAHLPCERRRCYANRSAQAPYPCQSRQQRGLPMRKCNQHQTDSHHTVLQQILSRSAGWELPTGVCRGQRCALEVLDSMLRNGVICTEVKCLHAEASGRTTRSSRQRCCTAWIFVCCEYPGRHFARYTRDVCPGVGGSARIWYFHLGSVSHGSSSAGSLPSRNC